MMLSNFVNIPFSFPFKLNGIILILVAVVSFYGCGGESNSDSTAPQSTHQRSDEIYKTPSLVPENLMRLNVPEGAEKLVYISFDEEEREQVIVNEDGNIHIKRFLSPGNHSFRLDFEVLIDETQIQVATYDGTIDIVAGETTVADLTEDMYFYDFDFDEDEFTNFEELDLGSDPLVTSIAVSISVSGLRGTLVLGWDNGQLEINSNGNHEFAMPFEEDDNLNIVEMPVDQICSLLPFMNEDADILILCIADDIPDI